MKYLRLTNGCWNKTCTFGGRGFYKEETDAIQDINASALVIFVVGVFTATLAAQSVELYPYAGGFWPSRVDDWGNNKLKSEGIYGLKGGLFLTENAEVEGSFGYINHFEMRYARNPGNLNPIRPELSASLPSWDSFMT